MSTDQHPSYLVTDPDGHDPEGEMTAKQATILRDLCERLDEPFDGNLTHRQANERIAALRNRLEG